MAYVLMRCLHHPDMDDVRNKHRPRHREWVGSGGGGLVCVLVGSAICDAQGRSIGNFGILESGSLEDARAFAEGDPFNAEGIVSEVDLTLLPDTFQAQRISDPMSPRLAG